MTCTRKFQNAAGKKKGLNVFWAFVVTLLSASVSACSPDLTDSEGRVLPDDSQIIRDVMPSDRENVIDVSTVDGRSGEAYFHGEDLSWYFDRGVVIRRKANLADLPDTVLVVGGLARYVYNGNSYEYSRFLVGYNEYEGVPRPSDGELAELVESRLAEVFVSREHLVVGVDGVQQVPDRRWTWHSPTSFSVPFAIRYRYRTSNASIDERDDIFDIRFYRESANSPIRALTATERERTVLSTATFDANDIDAMKTLRSNFN